MSLSEFIFRIGWVVALVAGIVVMIALSGCDTTAELIADPRDASKPFAICLHGFTNAGCEYLNTDHNTVIAGTPPAGAMAGAASLGALVAKP